MEKKTDGKGTTQYRYPKCPMCKSKKRHYENISAKAVSMGTVKPGYVQTLEHRSEIIADPAILNKKPVGTQAPSIMFALDICEDCGCVYAPMVITGKAEKQAVVAPPTKPKLFLPGQP